MTEKFTLFYDGPFSQWDHSPFVVGGIQYNCAEQFMMAQKALVFKDIASWNKIMSADHPAEQKALGRKVQGFDKDRWNQNAKLIVYRGNHAKFSQNHDHLHFLIKTGGTTLVEASPTDTIWGIGLDESDPRCHDRRAWRGLNWLGEVLTIVRSDIVSAMMLANNVRMVMRDER